MWLKAGPRLTLQQRLTVGLVAIALIANGSWLAGHLNGLGEGLLRSTLLQVGCRVEKGSKQKEVG